MSQCCPLVLCRNRLAACHHTGFAWKISLPCTQNLPNIQSSGTIPASIPRPLFAKVVMGPWFGGDFPRNLQCKIG